jgi:hypothetical protein
MNEPSTQKIPDYSQEPHMSSAGIMVYPMTEVTTSMDDINKSFREIQAHGKRLGIKPPKIVNGKISKADKENYINAVVKMAEEDEKYKISYHQFKNVDKDVSNAFRLQSSKEKADQIVDVDGNVINFDKVNNDVNPTIDLDPLDGLTITYATKDNKSVTGKLPPRFLGSPTLDEATKKAIKYYDDKMSMSESEFNDKYKRLSLDDETRMFNLLSARVRSKIYTKPGTKQY